MLRECLAGLAALHRDGIVHGDLKPSNIMLKRTGNAKIIDIGSAMDLRSGAGRRFWSPAYAAPEVLAGEASSPRSDLASLGYVLIEMLAGQSPFVGLKRYGELLEAKRAAGTTLAGNLADGSELQRIAAASVPQADRPGPGPTLSPAPKPPTWIAKARPTSIASWSRWTWPANTKTTSASGWSNWDEPLAAKQVRGENKHNRPAEPALHAVGPALPAENKQAHRGVGSVKTYRVSRGESKR